jgi:ABC-type Na+ transport system ATPase subunit NatA
LNDGSVNQHDKQRREEAKNVCRQVGMAIWSGKIYARISARIRYYPGAVFGDLYSMARQAMRSRRRELPTGRELSAWGCFPSAR